MQLQYSNRNLTAAGARAQKQNPLAWFVAAKKATLPEPLRQERPGIVSATVLVGLGAGKRERKLSPLQLRAALEKIQDKISTQLVLHAALPFNEFGAYEELSPYVKAAFAAGINDIVVSMQSSAPWSYDTDNWRRQIAGKMRIDGVNGLRLIGTEGSDDRKLQEALVSYARYLFGSTRVSVVQEDKKQNPEASAFKICLEKGEKLFTG